MNDDAEEFIRFVAETSTPAAMSVQEVEEKTWLDPEIFFFKRMHHNRRMGQCPTTV